MKNFFKKIGLALAACLALLPLSACNEEDKDGMKETILDLFNKYKENQLITKENESVKKYSRRALAKEYVNLIERILENEQH